ncbi:hypothetical protein K490DRAFT_53993 [Saccharata proteae CBS 121410]|uniref:Chromo domain-containing protein n=1 Tax=Saccharata proteae CBS 121410 TaxID=1314787 RepID=A0A9P4M1C1_9PEZI|nr:hypothetical protein K490DRAFT_53993 [Saccharata proteae CBS 121410]
MARPKRQRESTGTTTSSVKDAKRQRTAAEDPESATADNPDSSTAQPPQEQAEGNTAKSTATATAGQPDTEVYYSARKILKENKAKFLIDWAPNSQTGEVYEPTWEPKKNANTSLVTEWLERKTAAADRRDSSRRETPVDQKAQSPKRARGRPRKSDPVEKQDEPRKATEESEAETPKRKRGRPRKSRVAEGSDTEEETPIRKKRGRPRKSDTYKEPTESDTPKRKRGRPRKSQEVPKSTQDYVPSGDQGDYSLVKQRIVRTRRATGSAVLSSPARSSLEPEEETTVRSELLTQGPEEESLVATQLGRGSDPDQSQIPNISPQVLVQQRSDFNPEEDNQRHLTSQVCGEIQESPQAHPADSYSCDRVSDTQYPSNYQPAEQLLQPLRFAKDAIVPDSQEQCADDNYVPSTQTATQTASGEVSTSHQDTSESNNPTQSALIEETDPIEEFTICGASEELVQDGEEDGDRFNEGVSQVPTAQEDQEQEQPLLDDQCREAERHQTPNEISTQDDTTSDNLESQTVQAPAEEQRLNPGGVSTQDESGSNNASNRRDNSPSKTSSEHWQPAQSQIRIPDSNSQEYQLSVSEQRSGSQGTNINTSDRSATLLAEPEVLRLTVAAQSAEAVSNQEVIAPGDLGANPASPADRYTERQATPEAELEVSARKRESRSPAFDPEQASSSIPQLNSHLPETLGTDPPPRLQTPSDPPGTPKAQLPGHSTQSPTTPVEEERPACNREDSVEIRTPEDIKALWANVSSLMERVKSSPANAGSGLGTRSPSVIPPNPPESPMLPQKTLGPSRLSMVDRAVADEKETEDQEEMQGIFQNDGASSPGVLLEDPNVADQEFLIGIPLKGIQGDHYRRVINYYKKNLGFVPDSLGATHPNDDALAVEVEQFFTRLRAIQAHFELDYPEQLTQTPSQDALQAAWIDAEGSKFDFLGKLVDGLKHHYLHMVVLTPPGKIMNMLETQMRSRHVRLYRNDDLDMQMDYEPEGDITVRIVPTSGEGSTVDTRTADIIVSFDSCVDLDSDYIRSIRRDKSDPTKLAPVLTPVVVNGLDHIERCISPFVRDRERSRLIIKLTNDLKFEAGKAEYFTEISEVVGEVVNQSVNRPTTWELPQVGSIKPYVQHEDSLSQFLLSPSLPHGTLESVSGIKRRLDDTDDLGSPKKQRLTPQPGTVNPADITHISDSLANTQLPGTSDAAKYIIDEIGTMEHRLRLKGKQVRRLESAWEDDQKKHDDLGAKLLTIREERDSARAELVTAQKQRDTARAELASSKDEATRLRAELAEARTALSTSTVPGIAEFESLRRDLDDALAKAQRAETAHAALARDAAFYSEQYQNASRSATESSAALQILQKRLPGLEQQASGEAARARAISLDTAENAWKGEVERLGIQLRQRDGLVSRLWEENARLKGSRGVGTRAGSVPRSPRCGFEAALTGGSNGMLWEVVDIAINVHSYFNGFSERLWKPGYKAVRVRFPKNEKGFEAAKERAVEASLNGNSIDPSQYVGRGMRLLEKVRSGGKGQFNYYFFGK